MSKKSIYRSLLAFHFTALGMAAAQTATPSPTYNGPQSVLYLAPLTCQSSACTGGAAAEFEASLTQALQNSGYFRVIKRADIANLSVDGGVTNIEESGGGGFLFVAQKTTKVKAAIQVTDPITGELIFTEQCAGDSTSTGLAFGGLVVGNTSGYGKAAADCAVKLAQAITASARIKPYLTLAPGSALPAPRAVQPVATVPASTPALSPTASAQTPGTVTPEQATAVIQMLEGALKSLAFADVNALFTSDPYNPVKIKELNAAATTSTLQSAAKLSFKVANMENIGIGQMVGLTYTLPNGTEKFTQLAVLGPSQINSRGGVRLMYLSAFNPLRGALPQFEALNKNVEVLLADLNQAMGLPTP